MLINIVLQVAIKATEAEKAMLLRLGVVEEMRLANLVPLTRVPRAKKRKAENIDEADVKRSSARLNMKSKNSSEKEEDKVPTYLGETSQTMLKVHLRFK